MRINDNNTVLEKTKCSVQNNSEYQIQKVIYNVNSFFEGDKTIKEILFQKLVCENRSTHN